MQNLSKKEINRVNCLLKQSKLNLFDTEEKIASDFVTEKVCQSVKKCTPDIKKKLDIFLCSNNNNSEYKKLFNRIDLEGIANISQICSELEEDKNALNKVTIRTVFGGTEEMPFRSLIYLLPALNLCEELLKSNLKKESIPDIEYLFMNGAGVLANAIDPNKANNTTSQFINIAQKYIEEYHPNLKDKVNFYVDKNFSSKIVATSEYQKVHQSLEKELGIETDLRTDLIKMGERRNASKNSIRYAALHAFVQDGNVDNKVAKMFNFFGGKEQQQYDIIISIGAKPEERFYKARKLVAKEISKVCFFTPKKTVQYIANINVPPYSPLPTGELYLKDVLKNPEIIMNARSKGKGEYSEYQIPVQKAVESIIRDIFFSNSDKDIFEFLNEYIKEQRDEIIL